MIYFHNYIIREASRGHHETCSSFNICQSTFKKQVLDLFHV